MVNQSYKDLGAPVNDVDPLSLGILRSYLSHLVVRANQMMEMLLYRPLKLSQEKNIVRNGFIF